MGYFNRGKKKIKEIERKIAELEEKRRKDLAARDLRDPEFLNQLDQSGAGPPIGIDLASRMGNAISPAVAESPFRSPGAENLDLSGLLQAMQGQSFGQQLGMTVGAGQGPPGMPGPLGRGAVSPGMPGMPGEKEGLLKRLMELQTMMGGR